MAWHEKGCEFTALSWSTTKDILAIGSHKGEVTLLDIRQLKIPVAQMTSFSRPIHRLRFASHK